ncbi:biotin/lipoyl-containing protein [Pseudomonas luteola]
MERTLKFHDFGSEIYKVRSIHVSRGQSINVGQSLMTISFGNENFEVQAGISGQITSVLVNEGDRIKSHNAFMQIVSVNRDIDYIDRKAVGY